MTGLEQIALAALPDAVKEGEKELAKGLAGLLKSFYDDTLSPGAKQLGGIIEDLVKTVRLLSWPLQMGAALQERFRDDLFRALARVPEERRAPPPLKLFADICDGSKFETDPVLREMWSQLLSRGCDKERSAEAHPAFAGIIKQLSANEAQLLNTLYAKGPQARLSYSMAAYERDGRIRIDVELHPQWSSLSDQGTGLHTSAVHLRHLDLLDVNSGAGQPVGSRPLLECVGQECRITFWGTQFMTAVTGMSPAQNDAAQR